MHPATATESSCCGHAALGCSCRRSTFGDSVSACHCDYSLNSVLQEHGAGSRDAQSTRPPASAPAYQQTSGRKCHPCQRSRRCCSRRPVPVGYAQPTAVPTQFVAGYQPWCFSFSVSPARQYTADRLVVEHTMYTIYFTLSADGSVLS